MSWDRGLAGGEDVLCFVLVVVLRLLPLRRRDMREGLVVRVAGIFAGVFVVWFVGGMVL